MAHIREYKKIQNLIADNKKNILEKEIEIKKNSKITLEDSNQNLKIKVKKNVQAKIIHIIDKVNSLTNINIVLEKDSKLDLKQLIRNGRYVNIDSKIYEGAQLEQKLIYKIENKELFLSSKSFLEEKDSKVNMILKGVAYDNARVICDGVLHIKKEANNAQGSQEIRGILLDSTSNIQNEPILEINNNNVICSHSASISQIKDNIKFFMQSRGFNNEEIKNIIIEGLINEVLEIE